ncbi:hypothetical protein [Terrisporobacter vanillatitrophus]|uniref:hypothetical protein n=1 Tax=Terrisporobacter vanillatitrophus TaxID=3058402 RepID=UPI003368273A
MNNKMYNLNHSSHNYLKNNYEDNFNNIEWNNDEIVSLDDDIPINDDYKNEYSKKYSFPQKKGFTFKQNKYK